MVEVHYHIFLNGLNIKIAINNFYYMCIVYIACVSLCYVYKWMNEWMNQETNEND